VAIYHASLKVFSRRQGHTATGAAAYRAGLRIQDTRTGLTHDYTRRAGVVDARLHLTDHPPSWAQDPGCLWNAAEAAELRARSCVARELEVSLPAELNDEQRTALVSDLANLLVKRYAVAVQSAIHTATAKGDPRNHHVHLLFSVRSLGPDGFGRKVRILDSWQTGPQEIVQLRVAVALRINDHLERAGHSQRVDPRTLLEQARDAARSGDSGSVKRLCRQPTRHEGRVATAAKRRGANPERAQLNHAVRADNRAVLQGLLKGAPRSGAIIGPRNHASKVLGVRLDRARGVGADVLNAQADLVREAVYADQLKAIAYQAMLERVAREIASAVEEYARAMQLGAVDSKALLEHARRERACVSLLRKATAARIELDAAEERALAARDVYAQAAVRQVKVTERLEATEHLRPPVWRPLSRRDWAQRRRRLRADLEQARTAEDRAAKASDPVRRRSASALAARARRTLAALEEQRRKAYPVPSDGRRAIQAHKPLSGDISFPMAHPPQAPAIRP
jgi:hypothetical protein